MAHTQAGKGVGAVDVHGTAAANALTATTAEGQGRVQLVLDAQQGVQNHGAGLVKVKGVALHARLLGRLVRVPAVDLEGLEPGLLARRSGLLGGVGDLGHAADSGSGAGGDGGAQGRPRRSSAQQEGRRRADGGHDVAVVGNSGGSRWRAS